MTYYDTAYLAKCYLPEPGAAVVRAHARSRGIIACCDTERVELAAVLHRHLREGRLDANQYGIVRRQYESDLASGVWTWLPVTPHLLDAAANLFADLPPSCFLRAADALHIAAARMHGFPELFTNDRHLLAACHALGIHGQDLLSPPSRAGSGLH